MGLYGVKKGKGAGAAGQSQEQALATE